MRVKMIVLVGDTEAKINEALKEIDEKIGGEVVDLKFNDSVCYIMYRI